MAQVAKKQSTRQLKTEEQIIQNIESPGSSSYLTASVNIPIQKPDETGYVGRHRGRIDARLDTKEQIESFRKIYTALKLNNFKLSNGRYVDSAGDVIKWMMEQTASAASD